MISRNRAIFIDRDGTINEDVGHISDPAQLRLYDYAADAIRLINEAGWATIIITNQSGIARGLFTEDILERVHSLLNSQLDEQGAVIDGIYYCPHHPEFGEIPYKKRCDCRKPEPGLLHQAARDFDLDLKKCYLIGDKYRDIEAAHRCGSRGVLVLTGYGRQELSSQSGEWPKKPDHIADNLLDAVNWILCDF